MKEMGNSYQKESIKFLNLVRLNLQSHKMNFLEIISSDGVIDIKSKFYPYDGYKRFALDFIYKNIAKERKIKIKPNLRKKKKKSLKKKNQHLRKKKESRTSFSKKKS